jgi:L-lysine exporter family protein LysE/ArgO
MEYLILGFLIGLSLIIAIGAQNIFVIEQGLKKQYIFLVCLICSISDLILIFLGIFLFHYLGNFFNSLIELLLNIFLFIFLIHFIYEKITIKKNKIFFKKYSKKISISSVIIKTLAFTYLNPHVYSDTVFFLGNFSKNFLTIDKYYFGIGASIASFLFFFVIGYLSKFLSKYLQSETIWKRINLFIIVFMSIVSFYVLIEISKFF